MLRSVIWNGTTRPNSSTGSPNGIVQNAKNPGNIARIGAIR